MSTTARLNSARKIAMLRALNRYEAAEQLLSDEDALCETDEQRDAVRGLLLVQAEIGDPEAKIAPLRELFEKRQALATVLLRAG